mgnify:CR=1 FL=1
MKYTCSHKNGVTQDFSELDMTSDPSMDVEGSHVYEKIVSNL